MVTFPSAAAGPSFAAAAVDVAGRPPSGSSACGGVKVEVELDPGASVVDCDVEDAVAFASWSAAVICTVRRTAVDNCWVAVSSGLLGLAWACGGSPAEPVGRAGAMVANDSPDGCSAVAVAGRNAAEWAVGAVSTLADVAGTIAAAVDLLPYPWTLNSLGTLLMLSSIPFWQPRFSSCTRFCALSLTHPTWMQRFWTLHRTTHSEIGP